MNRTISKSDRGSLKATKYGDTVERGVGVGEGASD